MNGLMAFVLVASIAFAVGWAARTRVRPTEPIVEHLGRIEPFLRLPDGEQVRLDVVIRVSPRPDEHTTGIGMTFMLPGTDEMAEVPAGGSLIIAEYTP